MWQFTVYSGSSHYQKKYLGWVSTSQGGPRCFSRNESIPSWTFLSLNPLSLVISLNGIAIHLKGAKNTTTIIKTSSDSNLHGQQMKGNDKNTTNQPVLQRYKRQNRTTETFAVSLTIRLSTKVDPNAVTDTYLRILISFHRDLTSGSSRII